MTNNFLSAVSALEHDLESNLDLGLQIDAELRDARAQHEDDVATIERLRAELAASQARNVILADENRRIRTESNPEAIVASHRLNELMQANGQPPAAVMVYHHAPDHLGLEYTIVRPDGSRFKVSGNRVEGVLAKMKQRYGSVARVDGEPPIERERKREPPIGDCPRYLGNFTGD